MHLGLRHRRVLLPAFAFIVAVATSVVGAGSSLATATTPSVSGLSGRYGPVAGGVAVTVHGARLADVTRVVFGSSSARLVRRVSASELVVEAPRHSAGVVDVQVTTRSGTSKHVSADRFTYLTAPAVTKVVAPAGRLTGGEVVTISGARFIGVSSVRFGRVAATKVRVRSSTSLSAVAPPGAGGTVDVRVITAGGTSPATSKDRFSYRPAPVITSVSPAVGSTKGGNSVTIGGRNFFGITAVWFGFGVATHVKVISSTTLTAVTPSAPGESVVRIQVRGAYGSSASTRSDRYSYQLPPTTTVSDQTASTAIAGAQPALAGTACTSDQECFAVGHVTVDGTKLPIIETDDGSGWAAQVAPAPNNADDGQLSAIACYAGGCTAVGWVDVGNPAVRRPLIETLQGENWLAETAPQPAGGSASSFSSIACSAADRCVAGGYSSPTGPTVADFDSGSWSVQLATAPADATGQVVLTTAGCTTAGDCVIAGFAPTTVGADIVAELFDGTSWTLSTPPSPSADVTSALPVGISCPDASRCVLVGSSYGTSEGSFLSTYDVGQGWSTQAAPAPSDAVTGASANAQLEYISCTTSACVATGSYANSEGTQGYRITSTNGHVVATSNRVSHGQSAGTGVSCVTDENCILTGTTTPASGDGTAYIEADGPGGVQRTTVPLPADQSDGTVTVGQLSCNTNGMCAAIGLVRGTSTVETLISIDYGGL